MLNVEDYDGYSRTSLIARVQVLEEMLKNSQATMIDQIAAQVLPVFMTRLPQQTYRAWCEAAIALGKTYVEVRGNAN